MSKTKFLTKTDAVAAALREGILSGELKAGTQLLQEDVAEKLDVSPTPVREAFGLLEAEGFLERRPHRGVVVREWKYQDLEDVYEMRALVEAQAIRKIGQRVAPGDLDALSEVIADAKQASYVGDEQRARQANLRFHDRLVRMSGSQPIIDVMSTLLSKSMYYVPRDLKGLLHNSGEHEKIVAALRKGDSDKAARLMARHLKRHLDAVRKYHREVRSVRLPRPHERKSALAG